MPVPVIQAEGARSTQSAMLRVVGGSVRVDPDSYRLHTYGYRLDPESDNLQAAAYAIDLVQLDRVDPTAAPSRQLLEFGLAKSRERALGEREAFSWEYGDLAWQAKVISRAAAIALAQRDPAWQEVADGYRDYLRALVGWYALGSCWGPGRDILPDENKAGAGVVWCKGPEIQSYCGARYSVAIGMRSWVFDGSWAHVHFAPVVLSVYGYGENRSCRRDLFPEAARQECLKRGWDTSLFSVEEQAILLRASNSDIVALRWVVNEVIRDYVPNEPIHVLRTTLGASWTVLKAPDSPTSTGFHCSWIDDGTVWFAGPDSGGRGGRGEATHPGSAEVNVETRRGFCQNDQGSRVDFDLVPGDIVFQLQSGDGRIQILTPTPIAQPTPPTTGQPKPRKENRWTDWI